MTRRIAAAVATTVLTAQPAALICWSFYRGGHLDSTYMAAYFLPNYLYEALPHLLLVLVWLFSPMKIRTCVLGLVLLNLLLIGFQAWITLAVPVRESGIAWILYLPLTALGMAVFAGCCRMNRIRRKSG